MIYRELVQFSPQASNAARAYTGVVPTVIDEIVATTGASKQEVLEHFLIEVGSGATAYDMLAALLKRFEATA
jgi:hypothetical protein